MVDASKVFTQRIKIPIMANRDLRFIKNSFETFLSCAMPHFWHIKPACFARALVNCFYGIDGSL